MSVLHTQETSDDGPVHFVFIYLARDATTALMLEYALRQQTGPPGSISVRAVAGLAPGEELQPPLLMAKVNSILAQGSVSSISRSLTILYDGTRSPALLDHIETKLYSVDVVHSSVEFLNCYYEAVLVLGPGVRVLPRAHSKQIRLDTLALSDRPQPRSLARLKLKAAARRRSQSMSLAQGTRTPPPLARTVRRPSDPHRGGPGLHTRRASGEGAAAGRPRASTPPAPPGAARAPSSDPRPGARPTIPARRESLGARGRSASPLPAAAASSTESPG